MNRFARRVAFALVRRRPHWLRLARSEGGELHVEFPSPHPTIREPLVLATCSRNRTVTATWAPITLKGPWHWRWFPSLRGNWSGRDDPRLMEARHDPASIAAWLDAFFAERTVAWAMDGTFGTIDPEDVESREYRYWPSSALRSWRGTYDADWIRMDKPYKPNRQRTA